MPETYAREDIWSRVVEIVKHHSRLGYMDMFMYGLEETSRFDEAWGAATVLLAFGYDKEQIITMSQEVDAEAKKQVEAEMVEGTASTSES